MGKRSINGMDFAAMALSGAQYLKRNAEYVNKLNVFPVPDGDTGTNMNLTMDSGVRELREKLTSHLGKSAEALSKGLLMGARGNSGVILSQLFRGFSRSIAAHEQIDATVFALALQHGVDMAYKAVVKPVEGTILTVAKEAARHAAQYARRHTDMIDMMREVHQRANEALQRTPDQLPVLKQVGVVDSGGQGLVFIYEGFLQSLLDSEMGSNYSDSLFATSEAAPPEEVAVPTTPVSNKSPLMDNLAAQAKLSTADIVFPYDMEFFINRKYAEKTAPIFNEVAYKRELGKDGDSILVIVDHDIIKVHVHTRKPGNVLNLSLPYGELDDIQILNMREQHRDLVQEDVSYEPADLAAVALLAGQAPEDISSPSQVYEQAAYGIIAVAMGEGTAELFRSSDVDIVLSGGQTMNPSTEDFVKAIDSLSAEHIILLPNNSNIILAAEQAASLSERNVTVIPTRTVMQGLAAVLAFKEEELIESNQQWMISAAAHIKSGQVTTAIRDTIIDELTIKSGDYIGISEKDIVAADANLLVACQQLLAILMEDDGDLLTILIGKDADSQITAQLVDWLSEQYEELEIDVQQGGQPLYPYLFGLE
ncbi:DAK2 domain-containing protein [Paenibacillus yanchengensis]|uniref:DAK2 domain-containing protein n=1 Tax=Paenibacillus yanchengensis TaxID=2035833 RepID=A0ABW4YMK8_9BACL